MKIFLYLIISICSKWVFAEADQMVFNTDHLFNEIIPSKKFFSWNAVGDDLLALKDLYESKFLNQNRYLFSKNYSPIITPINNKPVALNKNSKEFFNGIEDQYFDGSYIGLKYYFFPELVLKNEEMKDTKGSPYFFYLIKKSSDLDLDLDIAKTKEEEKHWLEVNKISIKRFQRAYLKYILNGFFDEKELSEFKEAVDKGHLDSIYLYSCMRYLGKILNKDLVEARKYFKIAADKGHLNAQYAYAFMLYFGIGGYEDKGEAMKYFLLAAQNGHINSQYTCAKMLYIGIDKDLMKARKYFELAAQNGHKKAMFSFALMLFDGEGGEKDLFMASEYFRICANEGDPAAQFNYALMVYNDQSLDRNLNEAKLYFEKALECKQYETEAIFYIAMINLELRKDELKVNNKRPYPFGESIHTEYLTSKKHCSIKIDKMDFSDFDI